MPPAIATVVYAFGIMGLFVFDRDRESRTSKALWIPVVWLLIAGSRMVSQWLEMATPTDSPEQYLDGSPLDRIILAALLAAGIIVLLNRRREVGALLRANGPILLFFFYCAISIFWSDYPDVAFKRWIKALGDLVMVLIVLTDLDPSAAVKRFLTRASFLLVPVSVLLIKYYSELGRGYNRWTWTVYYTGVATEKNSLGYVCLVFGLASLWIFLRLFRDAEGTRRVGPLIVHGTLLVMVLWLFWKADSMTSLSCFLMAGGMIVVTSPDVLARKPAVVHLYVVAVLSISLFALVLDPGSGFLQALGRDPTLTGRTAIWSQVLRLTANPWVGTGFESFWLGQRLDTIWRNNWWHPNEAHNGYLEVYLNLGWIGVTLLAVVLATGYRNAVRAFRQNPDVGRLSLAYFVAAAAYSLTEAGFRMLNPVWITLLLATMARPQPAVAGVPDVSQQERPGQQSAEQLGDRTEIYEEVV